MNKKRRSRARKSRPKAKKPKYLSLRLQFPPGEAVKTRRIGETLASAASVEVATGDSKSLHRLNLVPLQVDRDQENVAYFFSAADDGATNLTGLLDDSADTPSVSSLTTNNSNRQDDLYPSSASVRYTYGGNGSRDGSAALVRKALRNRKRDSSEEKWVCYSEVVERWKIKEEEVTSSATVEQQLSCSDRAAIQGLSLKLDYQEILKAWSNKGPLYMDAESSQIVPDMSDDFLLQDSSYNVMGWGCCEVKMGLWTVPEMGQREASVLRYKEKRQNGHFSKKIRYQVRKLNSERRPRLKMGSCFQFQVGDRAGWSVPPVNETDRYNEWASRERFNVGDTLRFKCKKDSVMEVNKTEYNECNSSRPNFFSNKGDTIYTLDRSGFFYFMSGATGHCERGQRMIVWVIGQGEDSTAPPKSHAAKNNALFAYSLFLIMSVFHFFT